MNTNSITITSTSTKRTKSMASVLACSVTVLAVIVFAGGCARVQAAHDPVMPASPVPMHPSVAMAPEPFTAPQWRPGPPTDGSIWSQAAVNPFSDDKAGRPGDIVLVRVNQRSIGTKKANTDTSRKSSISAKIKYFLGLEDRINDLTGYTDAAGAAAAPGTAGWDPNELISAESSRSFAGKGATERSDTLVATISAVVTDVLANGYLVIEGQQVVQLNHEASILQVQGLVRPSDIEVDNSVTSDRIGNARIEFTGNGVVSDKQHPGWAMRVFDSVWPF